MKLLEKYYSTASEHVLSYSDFKLFSDLPRSFGIDGFDPEAIGESDRADIISRAEKMLEKPFPQTLASDFIRFTREDDRSIFEAKYFEKRHMTCVFALAEAIEKKGRFIDRAMDGVMLISDEQDWVIPAHIDVGRSSYKNPTLNPWFKTHRYIDLFAAETGSTLAFVYLLLHKELDKISPIICDRLRHELHTRIIKVFLAPANSYMWWLKGTNNWTPWILSNILTVCALTEPDLETRRAVLERVLVSVDNFIDGYASDGGCDEGPSYWTAAGAALFSLLELAYDFTGGYVDIFDCELIRKMGEYEADFHINGDYYVNFADCAPTVKPSYRMIARFGRRVGSQRLESFGKYYASLKKQDMSNLRWMLYQSLKSLHEPISDGVVYAPSKQSFYDGICVMLEREHDDTSRGFFLACKGGHNAESHNHNDIGNFIVYSGGEPLIVDSGSGAYTARTFGKDRYKLWTMVSEYHNLPTVNGFGQLPGSEYRATDIEYSPKSHKLSMNLSRAYDPRANIASLRRTAILEYQAISITDEIALTEPGEAEFTLLCAKKPTVVGKKVIFESGEKLHCSENLTPMLDNDFDMDMEDTSVRERWGRQLYRVLLKTEKFTSDCFKIRITR